MGFGRVSHGGVNARYYGRDKECTLALDSDGVSDTAEIISKWKVITQDEKLGNKEKKIRGRHDARVGTNIILSMPNVYSSNDCMEAVKEIISDTPASDCYWSAWIHKGEKNGIVNQHVHISINERLKSTGKKDRKMQRKGWFHDIFMKKYHENIKEAMELAPKRPKRERLLPSVVRSNNNLLKSPKKALNKPKKERYYAKLRDNGNFCFYDRKLIEVREDGHRSLPWIFLVSPDGQFLQNKEYELNPNLKDIFDSLIPQEIKIKMLKLSKINERVKKVQKQAKQAKQKPRRKFRF